MMWLLDIILVVLLAATLFHAVRLERALGVLKRDRVVLQEVIAGFEAGTRQAELGIARLHEAAEIAGQQITHQIATATPLKDDLSLLIERGNRLADRIDGLIHAGRSAMVEPPRLAAANVDEHPRMRSQAERDLLKALRGAQ
jgi:Domain of unknown function (DUF6468)